MPEVSSGDAVLEYYAARIAEPKRLRLRIFSVAGRLVHTARRAILKIPAHWPWAKHITDAHARLAILAATT